MLSSRAIVIGSATDQMRRGARNVKQSGRDTQAVTGTPHDRGMSNMDYVIWARSGVHVEARLSRSKVWRRPHPPPEEQRCAASFEDLGAALTVSRPIGTPAP